MPAAKIASTKPEKRFWSPKKCVSCGTLIETMKDANRIMLKDFAAAVGSTRFIWRHKNCA